MNEAAFRKHGLSGVLHTLTLSPSQSKVAGLAAGSSALVFGVPASGKTTALKALVLGRLHGGLRPEEILVLAANREAATKLRDELALEYQGSTPGPLARTIASFAFNILREKSLSLGIKPPELITGSEQDQILSELINDFLDGPQPEDWPKHLKRQVMELRGFRAELRDLVTVCLEHDKSPEQLIEQGIRSAKPEWVAMARFFEGYLNRLREPANDNRHDPSTLLTVVTRQLTTEDWPKVASDLKLIIVDDAQELTPAAADLLKSLSSKGADLVLIGDPDATTMGFRAADAGSMRSLQSALVSHKFQEIVLSEDIGSRHPSLTNALAAVAVPIRAKVEASQRRVLGQSKIVASENVEGKVFVEETAELAWLANRLRVLHVDDKIPWSQMAVVARSRSVLERWASALASESVPTVIHGSQTSFKDEYATGNLLRLAKFCIERPELTREVILDVLRNPYSGLDSLAIRRIRRRLRQLELDNGGQRTSDLLLIELFEKPEVASELYGEEGKRVRKFLKVLERATEQANTSGTTAEELLWTIWDNSPANENWLELSRGISEVALQAGRNLDSVVALFAAANRFAERHPGVPAAEFIEEQLERDIPQDTLALVSRDDEKVMLSVSPAMIGRRFKVVAIPGLTEGVWPNLKPRSSLLSANVLDSIFSGKDASQTRSELEDEYRLFYKAVGAASERLIVTAVNSEEQQVSQFVRTVLGTVPVAEPYAATRYTLRGMVGNLRRTLVTTEDEAERLESAYGLARLALENQPGANPKQWAGILRFDTPEALVPLEDGEDGKVWIYPSQLDAFIKCPLHWFMQAHGGTDKSFEANFGTLLHKVLEETESISYADLWKGVQSKWHTLDFEATWVEKREERKAKKMVEYLSTYLEKRRDANYKLVGTEVELDFEYGRARIKGRVDRVEQGPDGKILIVDLKTGTSAPKAEENSQLGLYQIAFLEGGFKGAVDSTAELEGAALLLVGGKKDDLRPQASLSKDEELQKFFRDQLDTAIEGMSAADATFIANVGSHCSDSRGYGNCNLLLTKAVSYVD